MCHHRNWLKSPLALTVLACGAVLVGCGSDPHRVALEPPAPRHLAPGLVASVGDSVVTLGSFHRWLATALQQTASSAAEAPRRAVELRTVGFLIKAQWLIQQSEAELAKPESLPAGATAFQTRLGVLAGEVQGRHRVASVTSKEVASYYAAHSSEYHSPRVADTLMVVTTDRGAALRARKALAAGQAWGVVAKKWSDDPSGADGGGYAVTDGVQSPELVRAVFATPRGELVGPLLAATAARPRVKEYFLFRVTGEQPAKQQPFSQVAAGIHAQLEEQAKARALAAFTRTYEAHWRSLTLCATGYIVLECSNYHAAKSTATK
jgi:hypothetical protein